MKPRPQPLLFDSHCGGFDHATAAVAGRPRRRRHSGRNGGLAAERARFSLAIIQGKSRLEKLTHVLTCLYDTHWLAD